ncbi:MAG: beta-ketoacyl synthase N-terminal-like domain-containing protein, partial [bacterium]
MSLPLVQGPMACVTDHPGLCVEVSRNGALPFVATASLSGDQCKQLISETQKALDGKPFGVGIVSFADPDRNDEMLAALVENRPPFVTIAGGNHQLANLLEEKGVRVYLHAPSVAHIRQFLDAGVLGLIVEGHEAGGHIGALPSLILWELAVRELADRTMDRSPVRLLLAGGLASDLGSALAAAVVAPLDESEVEIGLQLGTAYLLTDEAVRMGAIPESYQVAMVTGSRTAITGQSVNLPSRWIQSQAVDSFLKEETRLLVSGVPLAERKKLLEAKAFSATRAALEGRQRGEASRKGPQEDVERPGLVSAGQVVSVVENPRPISELHLQLSEQAAQLIDEACLVSAWNRRPWIGRDDDREIAIVGIGCIFPDASCPEQFWQNLLDRRDSIREVPEDRWNPEFYYSPKPCPPDKTYSKIGGFVTGFEKDPIKFRIPPISAPNIARAQFMALEVAHQALEDGGYLESDFPRDKTGVFIGTASGGALRENLGLRVHWDRFA